MRERWIDIINPQKRDDRTGEEIVADVLQKIGLQVVSE